MENNQLKQLIDTSSRIILKVGSSLLINENNNDINYHWLKNFSKEILSLTNKKKQIMIVSSGSVALGRKQLNLVKNLSLDEKQAAAAVGQIHLSHAWKEVLKSFNLESAQILLAPDDTETRRKHLNARATLLKLLQLNVIPVINENDTVSTDEIILSILSFSKFLSISKVSAAPHIPVLRIFELIIIFMLLSKLISLST